MLIKKTCLSSSQFSCSSKQTDAWCRKNISHQPHQNLCFQINALTECSKLTRKSISSSLWALVSSKNLILILSTLNLPDGWHLRDEAAELHSAHDRPWFLLCLFLFTDHFRFSFCLFFIPALVAFSQILPNMIASVNTKSQSTSLMRASYSVCLWSS